MMQIYWLGYGVAYLLQNANDAGNAGSTAPSLFDAREWLESYRARGREGQWMDSTRRVIETLCFGQIGRVVRGDSNAEFEKILKSQAVLELYALSNADKTTSVAVRDFFAPPRLGDGGSGFLSASQP